VSKVHDAAFALQRGGYLVMVDVKHIAKNNRKAW